MNKEVSIKNYIKNNQSINLNKFTQWISQAGVDKWIECSSDSNIVLKTINAKHIKTKLQSLPEHTDHINVFKNSKTKAIYITYQVFHDYNFICNEINEWNNENIYDVQVYEPQHAWQGNNYCLVVITLHD